MITKNAIIKILGLDNKLQETLSKTLAISWYGMIYSVEDVKVTDKYVLIKVEGDEL